MISICYEHLLKECENKEISSNSHKQGLFSVSFKQLLRALEFICHLSFIFFRDIKKFKDAKKQFEKVSEEKENALVKNAQVQRNKQHEVEEATNILTATRKCFRHIALDYVLQVSAAIMLFLQI